MRIISGDKQAAEVFEAMAYSKNWVDGCLGIVYNYGIG